MHNKFWPVLLLVIFGYLFSLNHAAANETRQAAIETDAEFRSVVESVDKTREWIDSANKKLSEAAKLADGLPLSDRKKARKAIAEMKKTLRKQSKMFSTFGKSAKHVTNVLDVAKQIDEIQQLAQNRQGGPLAYQMSILSSIFDKTESLKKVPLIGDILSGYNDAVIGLLNSTDKVAKSLDENRKHGMVGLGVPNYLYDPKYIAMKKQFGSAVADANTWIPEGPSFVYRNSINKNTGMIMIWDESSGEWYKIEQGSINIEKVYSEGLKIDKQFTPHQLKVYADKWQHVEQRRQDADLLFRHFNKIKQSLNSDHEAFDQLDSDTRRELRALLNDPEMFRIWYTFDRKKFQLINRSKVKMDIALKEIHQQRDKQKLKKRAAQRLAELKAKASLKQKPDNAKSVAAKPVAANSSVANSAVTPQTKTVSNCDNLPVTTITAINNRLAKSTASEIASLSVKILAKGDRQSLMNCLCAKTSQKSSSVSKFYDLKPVNSSPSCSEPANGACVNQGMGCVRHPLTISQETLDSCNAGYAVARQLCKQGVH